MSSEAAQGAPASEDTFAGWKRTALLAVLVLAAAGAALAVILTTEPTAERAGATKETAMLVETASVERGTFRPTLVALGTVVPEQDVELRAQVPGRVVSIAPGLVPGGFVEEGEVLVTLEAADYEHALAQRRSDLRQARADLAVEEGRQDVARQEYELLGERLPREDRGLVLREPQLQAARGRVSAARAAVAQAKLDLARTTVEAPFAAHVLRRDVNVGSQVTPDTPLVRLVGLGAFWVQLDVPLDQLRFIAIPERDGDPASAVQLRHDAWPEGAHRDGRLLRLIGALDDRTRMARVLASIPDPLGRRTGPGRGGPPLMIGAFVEARIEGIPVEDVVRLDRQHVREGDTVWTLVDGALRIADVDVLLRDGSHAYVTRGLDAGARVVTTHLSTVTEGAPLRVEPAEAPPP